MAVHLIRTPLLLCFLSRLSWARGVTVYDDWIFPMLPHYSEVVEYEYKL
jgi:hypothetical protein